jgi:hypothetical protein
MNVHAASLTALSLPVPAVSSPSVARVPPDRSLPPGQRNWHEHFPYRDYVELAPLCQDQVRHQGQSLLVEFEG